MGNNKWGKWKEYFVGDEIKKEKKKCRLDGNVER